MERYATKQAKDQAFENREVALVRVENGSRNKKKDVRNEGRSDYVHENTRATDKVSRSNPGFFDEDASIARS
jgi:hypothetical protein